MIAKSLEFSRMNLPLGSVEWIFSFDKSKSEFAKKERVFLLHPKRNVSKFNLPENHNIKIRTMRLQEVPRYNSDYKTNTNEKRSPFLLFNIKISQSDSSLFYRRLRILYICESHRRFNRLFDAVRTAFSWLEEKCGVYIICMLILREQRELHLSFVIVSQRYFLVLQARLIENERFYHRLERKVADSFVHSLARSLIRSSVRILVWQDSFESAFWIDWKNSIERKTPPLSFSRLSERHICEPKYSVTN